jgi:iron complex transport system substrate-binding protein
VFVATRADPGQDDVRLVGSTVACAGSTIPDRDRQDPILVDVSPERVPEAAADHVFVTTTDVQDQSSVPTPIRDNPTAFPAVSSVDTSSWVSRAGSLGGQRVLDEG